MCGILVTTTRGETDTFTHRHLSALRRRGPDAIGFWVNQEVRLAHTRLSIIGLDERGNQPMENERHVLAFNGQIYNFERIRDRLAGHGIRVRGATDTEVLLNAWTLWGPDCLTELTGFWAFAVYDKQEKTLTLVRDQLGVKPLYYLHTPECTIVSSLLKTIVEIGRVSFDLDYEALSEYARYQFTFGDKTFFRQIKKVEPGHYVRIGLASGNLSSHCYEDILNPSDRGTEDLSAGTIEITGNLIAESCAESTVSDTSFTTFCSGGVDSSLITAITDPDVAYHCNYTDPECNETFFAREVVRHINQRGGKTRLMVVNGLESFNVIDRINDILDDFDEITVGSVIFPLDDILTRIKARYKVVLSGTGADELFAGYVRYQLVAGCCFQDSYRMMYESMRRTHNTQAGTHTTLSAQNEAVDRFEFTHTKGNTGFYRFYNPAVEKTFRAEYERCGGDGGDLAAMLTFDRRHFLAGLLNIDDKMCGRHSIESRPSLLNQKLVRHVVRLRPAALMANNELKYLLRTVAANYLPAAVTRRMDKMGFTTPVGDFINKNAHVIREQIMNSKFRHLYNLKPGGFYAENKFSRESFGLVMLDCWLNKYACSQQSRAEAA